MSKRGGWRGHPNSLAVLARYRVNLSDPRLRRCVRCRRVARRGKVTCVTHGGRRRDTPGRLAARLIRAMAYRDLLPPDLISLPLWRATPRLPCNVGDPLRLRLVLAWDSRDEAPLAWAALWREAVAATRDVAA